MKKIKSIMKLTVMLFAFGLIFTVGTVTQAASEERKQGTVYVNPYKWKSVAKMRIEENDMGTFRVYYGDVGEYITDVKVNKKGLTAALTSQTTGYSYDSGYGDSYWYGGTGTITVDAAKAGTYTVSFVVHKADGSARGTYKMKVYCTKDNSVYNKIKLGKTTIYQTTTKKKGNTTTTTGKSSYKVSAKTKSAKLKITPNKGYSITGMIVVSRDKNGKPVCKSVKNGKSIKLSSQYAYRSYNSDGSSSRSTKIYTNIFVSYKDKYLGTSVKYSITKKHGIKEIKRVEKNPDGTSSVDYYDYDDGGNIILWRY